MISFFISTTCMYLKNQICILRKDEKNSNLHLEKMQICFYVEKNLDMYLEKMQICFILIKKIIHMQIIDIQERGCNNHIKKTIML